MMDGDVSAVRALELGADIKLSVTKRSLGETVPGRLELELLALWLPLKPKVGIIAGDEKAVWPPSPKAVNSSKSTSGLCERWSWLGEAL